MQAIAAMSLNRVIGKDGEIPWKCSDDLKWFKEFTLGETIVVGRKTYEKLPPLKNRKIIVLSKNHSPCLSDYPSCDDINDLPKDVIVAGGAKVYEELLPYCDSIYLTLIRKFVEGDTYMPLFEHLFPNEQIIKETDEYVIIRYYK